MAVKAAVLSDTHGPVSYTHLDVYKRQADNHAEAEQGDIEGRTKELL